MNNKPHVQNINTQYQPKYSILDAVKTIKELSPNNPFIKIMDKTVDIYIKTVSSINDLIKLYNISRSDIAVATGCSLKEIDRILNDALDLRTIDKISLYSFIEIYSAICSIANISNEENILYLMLK